MAGGIRLDIEVFGDRQISRRFTSAAATLKDARPAWHRIVDLLLDEEAKQFDTEGGHASSGWTPLAPSTVAAKQALGLDPRILHATGRLRESLTERGAPDQTVILAPAFMVFGSTVPYGKYHQTGGGRLPQRKPFELTDRARREAVRIIQREIMGVTA